MTRRIVKLFLFGLIVAALLFGTVSAYVANVYRGGTTLGAAYSYAASNSYGGLIGRATGYNNSGSAGSVRVSLELSSGAGWVAYDYVILPPGSSGGTGSWGRAPQNYLYRVVLQPTTNPGGYPGRIASGSVYTD